MDLHASLARTFLPGHHGQAYLVYAIAPFAALAFATVLIVLGLRKLPPAYSSWALIGILVPLLYPTTMRPLYSLHRFVLLLFPLFMVEAYVTRKTGWLRWVLLALSAAGLVYYTLAFASFAPIG
ncbi:MAG TPA: hypothetical protein VFD50_07090 [Thermoleophilia bacterium]|nr:hypothetical protein [Thermoleophilia bacterium]